jgi:gliding motility-associated protein GldC
MSEIHKRTKIEINVGLNENRLPVEMHWEASDGAGSGECKAMLLALWDGDAANAMRIDLWNNDMSVYDMQRFFHQTLFTMGDTFERATGNKDAAAAIREFARTFATKVGIMG